MCCQGRRETKPTQIQKGEKKRNQFTKRGKDRQKGTGGGGELRGSPGGKDISLEIAFRLTGGVTLEGKGGGGRKN